MRDPSIAFAEFIDFCCGRYAKSQAYRRTLDRERPTPPPAPMRGKNRKDAA